MKNLRVSKKNPSKILKIIDTPQTHRYSIHENTTAYSFHIQDLAIASSKEKHPLVNISTHRERGVHSPSRSHRFIDFSSLERNKKVRNKSLNRSEEMIKSQEKGSSKLVTKQSIQIKSRNEHSPYLRNNKFRESDKFLNFNSVNLGERGRRDSRDSREILKSSSRKKQSFLKIEGRQESQREKKAEEDILESAKKMMNNGDYRKSLLIVKSILKSKPEHVEALYLSAVNWHHLEDRAKAHQFAEQVIRLNPRYSPECYKVKAVCYFKTLEYSKSLVQLKQCHQLFPEESESYELQGKIYLKMRKWRDAIKSYLKAYQFSGNLDMLGAIGSCFQELNDYAAALDYYERAIRDKPFPMKFILKKMRLHGKMEQYQLVVKTMESIEQLQSLQLSRQKDEIYYLCSYAHYKLSKYTSYIEKYSNALIVIDQGLRNCQYQVFATKFNRLLLMIKIMERDIYEAYHLIERLQDQPELMVLRKFVEGVISLMRRNYNEGIIILLSIQKDLGFRLNIDSRCSNMSLSESEITTIQPVADQFLNELKHIYLLFLSYGYITISEFHSALRLLDLQKQLGVPSYFELGFSYNLEMCLGIIRHCDRRFRQAQNHFIKAKAIYQNKLEPPFSLALNYLQLMLNSESEVIKLEMIEEAKGQFDCCKKIVGKTASNTAASVYYFNSLLHGHLEQWKEALTCIDQSIDRSEDHYWRYFYIRGMLLASVHSFKQAVNDLSVAINLSGNTKPQCYLLRSKCLQIQGEGNEAFKDLQQYISLKPDDPEVHKYAGQLLFQNGAFEDSLTALGHQPIPLDPKNYDIFLTQAKSYFLLGRFSQAITSISKANSLLPNPEVAFDIKVFHFLQFLIVQKDPSGSRIYLQETFQNSQEIGRIFKISDFNLLRATCLLLEEQYPQAIEAFHNAIRERVAELKVGEDDDESNFIENKKEIDTFSNQVRYNLVLCYLNMHDEAAARDVVKQIDIDLDQPYYGDFVQFKKFVMGDIETFKKEEVFPSRNKLSNFIQKIKVTSHNRNPLELKLCIPFPKVEPPEIFPAFDNSLLMRLSVLNVERKPEAPWILRETNSIKFTDKIEVYSRLQLQDSESESTSTFQILSVDHSHIGKQSHRSKPMFQQRMESKSNVEPAS